MRSGFLGSPGPHHTATEPTAIRLITLPRRAEILILPDDVMPLAMVALSGSAPDYPLLLEIGRILPRHSCSRHCTPCVARRPLPATRQAYSTNETATRGELRNG